MYEYYPCMGCEYYNKPYWSVVSPCKSCPRIYNANGYNTTTTTDATNINIKKTNGYTSLSQIIDELTEEEINDYLKSTIDKMIMNYVDKYYKD